MDRRSLLKLLGAAGIAAPALPSVVTSSVAASATGVSLATNIPPLDNEVGSAVGGWSEDSFWGSLEQLLSDVKRNSDTDAYNDVKYSHMKSWGKGFKKSVYYREELAMRLFQREMERNKEFRERLFSVLRNRK